MHIKRLYNSGLTIIDIDESIQIDDQNDPTYFNVDLRDLYWYAYLMRTNSTDSDGKYFYQIAIQLDTRVPVGTYNIAVGIRHYASTTLYNLVLTVLERSEP